MPHLAHPDHRLTSIGASLPPEGSRESRFDGTTAPDVRARRPLDPPLLIVIDEAANLKLQDLPEWAATLSGLGVQLVTVWQSIVQIEAVYGDQAGAILTNHPTKLFYPGMSDLRGLETASSLIGREHLPGRLGESHVRAEYASPTQVDYAPAATIRQLRPGDALLIHATLPPAVIDVTPRRRRERKASPPPKPSPRAGCRWARWSPRRDATEATPRTLSHVGRRFDRMASQTPLILSAGADR